MHNVVRHGSAMLLLAIVANAWPWTTLAAMLLGIALGAATAMTVMTIMRGLHMPRWSAWAVSAIVFVAILSHAIGGF
ncbi:MAG: mechanosensitive ion channel protein MscS, partial [Candidatus Sericytochromatia bacterium]